MGKNKKKQKIYSSVDTPEFIGTTEDWDAFANAVGEYGDLDYDPFQIMSAVSEMPEKSMKSETPDQPLETKASERSAGKGKDGCDEHSLMETLLTLTTIGVYDGSPHFLADDVYVPVTAGAVGTYLLANLSKEKLTHIPVKMFESVASRLKLEPRVKNLQLQTPHGKVLFENGVFDIITDEWAERETDEFFSFRVNAEFKPRKKKDTPVFDLFLDNCAGGDRQIRERILCFMGYMLLPGAPAKNFFVLGTAPDSGKSQLAKFLQRLIGVDNTCSIGIHEFGNEFVMGQIYGKAANFSMDVSGITLSAKTAANLKTLTGDDSVTINQKYAMPFRYCNYAKLVFATNARVSLATNDTAFWNRLVVVPFLRSIPKEKQIPDLADELWEERNGIVQQAVRAAARLIENRYVFPPCAAAKQMKRMWQSTIPGEIGDFLQTNCTFSSETRTASSTLYEAYCAWCAENDLRPESETLFVRTVKQHPNLQQKRWSKDGVQQRGLQGIKLLPEENK